MPNLYARSTPLPNVCGRIAYISDPKRQENLLAFYDSTEGFVDGHFWEQLAYESQRAFATYSSQTYTYTDRKTGEKITKERKCREGREIHFALPNGLIPRLEPEEIAEIIAKEFQEKVEVHTAVAVHHNKAKNNLHAHVIFSERVLLENPEIKIAERNLFFDAAGKRHYKKSEILDEDGELLPGCYIVPKGEIYEQNFFSAAEPKFADRFWLKEIKTDVILPLLNGELAGDVEITEYDPSTGKLAQQHVGKKVQGKKREDAERCNGLVKEFNGMVDAGTVTLMEALEIQREFNSRQEKTEFLEKKIREIRRRKKEELLAAAKKKRAQEYYSRPDFWSSKYNRPYQVGMYDKFGRKRTIIELLVMLAIEVIRGEGDKWMSKKDPAYNQVTQRDPIHATRDWKVQNMVDTIALASAEKVRTLGEVEEKLNSVGKDLSKTRAEHRRLTAAKNRMEVLKEAIAGYNEVRAICEEIYAMPDGPEKSHLQEKYANEIKEYKEHKAVMYRHNVLTESEIADFAVRYDQICEKIPVAEEHLQEKKEQYRRLSKLRYNILLAQNKQYCYGPEYKEPEQEPKQEPGQEQSVQDRYVDLAEQMAAAERRRALEAKEKEDQHQQSSGNHDDHNDFDSL